MIADAHLMKDAMKILLLVSATVCSCPQPFATVRNRLQPSVCDRRGRKVAVPIGKVAKKSDTPHSTSTVDSDEITLTFLVLH